ncbi:MAG TPA: 30S ribosomal protein S1 [Nitrospiraceae bacterium]|nr:30S ribosomal protein S1 [Nitrospiraceae bacterium]
MDEFDQSAGNNDNTEENFEELLEKNLKTRGRLEPGQMVEAAIVSITADWIFLDLGGKGEGALDKKEMVDAEGNLTVKEGDRIRAYFLSSENNELLFTTRIGTGPAGNAQLEDAWRNGISVDGTVAKEIKGGFEVKIGGSVRAFCPYSLMGLRRDEPPADSVGKTLSFMISEYGEEGRNIVVSRKAIVDEERRGRKEALKETLSEGMRIRGTVTSTQTFGAFVDIGGIEGLLPISEIAWTRTEKVSDVLSSGQEIEVIIKSLDWEKERFSFSLKDALPDPWERVAQHCPVGSYHTGTVARLAPFGAFITLAAGVDGLAHISKVGAGRRISHPREVLKEGQTIEVKVEAVDIAGRKISLSLAEISREEEDAARTLKEYRQKEADTPGAMGTIGDILKAQLEKKEKQ